MNFTFVFIFLRSTFNALIYSIVLYFLYVLVFRPILDFLKKIYHYHGLHCIPKNPIFGHLKFLSPNFPFPSAMEDISKNIYTFFDQSVGTNKDRSLSVLWFGLFPVIIVSDHEAVEAVMTKSNLKKPFFYKYIGLKNGLVTSDPGLWKIRRKAIEPFFVTRKQRQFVKFMDEEIKTLPGKLADKIGEPVDIEHLIHSSALTVISKAVGSIPMNDLEDEKYITINVLATLEEIAMKRIANPLFWFDQIVKLFETGKTYFLYLNKIDSLISKYMDHREKIISSAEPIKPEDYDLVHYLEPHTDRKGAEEEVVTTIAAGHETVSVSLRWTLFSLGNNPEVQERLYQEIIENFPGDNPVNDFDKVNSCTYLDQVLKESLRLNPPIHFIGRVLDSDVTVKGIKIMKDTNVFVCIMTTHRDPSVYPEPDKFDPERWNPENVNKIPKAAFIPFGYGPRNCIGYRYALTELKVYIIYLLRNFSIKSTRKPDTIHLKAEISLKPVEPLEIILTPRNNNNL